MSLRIHMFSGPRNISTTMMRAFENRADTAVVDEPFYASYLVRSGADHPYREETLAVQPHDIEGVLRRLNGPPETFGEPGAAIVFAKHIAYHFPDDVSWDWLAGGRTFLLIREPRAMIASYSRKLGDIDPIVRSFAVERRIFDHLRARDAPCPVVDAADVLADPAGMMRALCAALDISYTAQMLSWPAGPRPSDGPWAPHWYDAVRASTGFRQVVEKIPDLPPALAEAAEKCAESYRFLRSRRLRT